jgi:hypothetical protein
MISNLQLLPPRFKFQLFLTDGKEKIILCFADTYEVKENGAITFYQIATNETKDKQMKIPVLSYSSNKWEGCVLIDDFNKMPAFQEKRSQESFTTTRPTYTQPTQDPQQKQEPTTDLSELESLMEDGQDNNLNNNNITNNIISNTTSTQQHHNHQNMPGISSKVDLMTFKKMKTEFLEKELKNYSKTIETFNLELFLDYISKSPEIKQFGKITETDLIWTASTLIRNKLVLARKFADPSIQKTLELILPDIMRRHWAGKMAPIIQVLKEKEETKNITAIDLAVWMAGHGFD